MHLLSDRLDEFGEQDGMVAFGAVATETERAAEDMALGAAALADEAVFAARAFVDGLRDQGALALQDPAQGGQLCGGALLGGCVAGVAQAEGLLPARRGAIARASRRQRPGTDGAA